LRPSARTPIITSRHTLSLSSLTNVRRHDSARPGLGKLSHPGVAVGGLLDLRRLRRTAALRRGIPGGDRDLGPVAPDATWTRQELAHEGGFASAERNPRRGRRWDCPVGQTTSRPRASRDLRAASMSSVVRKRDKKQAGELGQTLCR
jgi:hypothetical protein